MIALRYGTVPIVRKTGGLADTISTKNGFIFEDFTKEALFKAIDEAILTWKNQPEKWAEYLKEGMSTDFSWKNAAKEYLAVYANVLKSVAKN
jgi:starch synthase